MESATFVMDRARDVSIHDVTVEEVVHEIAALFRKGIDNVDAFGSAGDLEKDVNIVFFQTAINFCFWPYATEPWSVAFEGETHRGWYGMAQAFHRAVAQGRPVHDAEWMLHLSLPEADKLFRGVSTPIPLLEQRVNNIIEMAEFLKDRYGGSGLRMLEVFDFQAPRIVRELVQWLPSFRDGAWYDNRWVWILKRAQILPADLHQLKHKYPDFSVHDVDQLTVFADYRLPQVLRHKGVLEFSECLARQVDAGKLIPAGSAEEIEIRMATIIACAKVKAASGAFTNADIDLGLWMISQSLRDSMRPHHKTVSQYY